ncbi:MAG TPA: DUF2917 domain-containing protein [Burkholderiales bacterium]
MRVEMEPGAIRLLPHQTLRVRDGAGATICAREGTVWITEEANPQDVVLEPGGCYRLRHAGLTLVNGFGDAAITLN